MVLIIILFYVFFFVLFFYGIKKKNNTESKAQIISIDESNAVKGLAAVMIFLAHSQNFFAENSYNTPFLKPFSLLGGMGVLLFFFFSGYGIGKGYILKDPTIKFWKNRLLKIFIPSCIISAFSTVIIFLVKRESFKLFFQSLFGGQWYIDVIMLCYFAFFISWIISKKNRWILLLLTTIFCIAIGVFFFLLKFNARWYNGIMLFPFGLFISIIEKDFKKLKNGVHITIAILSIVVFIALGGLFAIFKGYLFADIFKTFSGLSLSMFFVELIHFFEFGNPVSKLLGIRSLYVYLCHLWLLDLLTYLAQENVWFKNHIICDFYILLIGSIVFTEICFRVFMLFNHKK